MLFRSNLSSNEISTRRTHIMKVLRKISPGRPTHLQAVISPEGDISTDPTIMANTLRNHWSKIFQKRHCHKPLLSQWLQEDLPPDSLAGLPSENDPSWALDKDDIRRAIKRSPNTSPGPDGIPFGAWRKLGELAVDTLFRAYQSLSSDNSVKIGRAHV